MPYTPSVVHAFSKSKLAGSELKAESSCFGEEPEAVRPEDKPGTQLWIDVL